MGDLCYLINQSYYFFLSLTKVWRNARKILVASKDVPPSDNFLNMSFYRRWDYGVKEKLKIIIGWWTTGKSVTMGSVYT